MSITGDRNKAVRNINTPFILFFLSVSKMQVKKNEIKYKVIKIENSTIIKCFY